MTTTMKRVPLSAMTLALLCVLVLPGAPHAQEAAEAEGAASVRPLPPQTKIVVAASSDRHGRGSSNNRPMR